MKKYLLYIKLTFIVFGLSAQSNNKFGSIINSFKDIENMPYICRDMNDCGDSIFWNAVSYGDRIIPQLIERLNDTTTSKEPVPNFGGNYVIGDICLTALDLLVWDIPISEFTENMDEKENGFWYYWDYIRENKSNRDKFKYRVQDWYNKNINNFNWVYSEVVNICDCENMNNPAGGYFELLETYAIFIGTVKKIDLEYYKEGKFEAITFKIDSIIKYDTLGKINDKIYLNKNRKKAIVFEEPKEHDFKVGETYYVSVSCCNVDHYRSIRKLTKKYNKNQPTIE